MDWGIFWNANKKMIDPVAPDPPPTVTVAVNACAVVTVDADGVTVTVGVAVPVPERYTFWVAPATYLPVTAVSTSGEACTATRCM